MSVIVDYPVRDLRSNSVDQLRAKQRRVKYRGVNANLLGAPMSEFNPKKGQWTARNIYKMPRQDFNTGHCSCYTCSSWQSKKSKKQKAAKSADYPTKAVAPPRNCALRKLRPVDDDNTEDEDDSYQMQDYLAGPAVSGQLVLNHKVTEALEKFQAKELMTIVKNEYEVVAPVDIAEEEFVLV